MIPQTTRDRIEYCRKYMISMLFMHKITKEEMYYNEAIKTLNIAKGIYYEYIKEVA